MKNNQARHFEYDMKKADWLLQGYFLTQSKEKPCLEPRQVPCAEQNTD